MQFSRIKGTEPRGGGLRISPTAILIVLFWLGQFGFLTLQRHLYGLGEPDGLLALLPRSCMCGIVRAISFGRDRVHRSLGGRSGPRRRIFATLAAAGGMV